MQAKRDKQRKELEDKRKEEEKFDPATIAMKGWQSISKVNNYTEERRLRLSEIQYQHFVYKQHEKNFKLVNN